MNSQHSVCIIFKDLTSPITPSTKRDGTHIFSHSPSFPLPRPQAFLDSDMKKNCFEIPPAQKGEHESYSLGSLQSPAINIVGWEEADVGVHPVLHSQLHHRQAVQHIPLHLLLQVPLQTGHQGLVVAILLSFLPQENRFHLGSHSSPKYLVF